MDESKLPKRVSPTKAWHTKPYPFIEPTRPELSAAGRNIVITGGGTGIGNAIGVAFARAGAKSVAILGRRADALEAGAAVISAAALPGTRALTVPVDLLDAAQTAQAFRTVVEQVGKIDVLVSNAGVLPGSGSLVDQDAAKLVQSFEGNVVTAFHAFQAFLPLAGPAPILLSTSTAVAHMAPITQAGLYALARAAHLKMTDYFAAENPHVHVVSIQPGWVATAMNGHQKEAPDSPELPGAFYVWLASPEAKFLNGKFVWTNWDAQELVERAEEIKTTKLLNWIIEGVPM